jgi:hypothetical protein
MNADGVSVIGAIGMRYPDPIAYFLVFPKVQCKCSYDCLRSVSVFTFDRGYLGKLNASAIKLYDRKRSS